MEEISATLKERILKYADNKEDTLKIFFNKVDLKYGNFKGKSLKSDLGSEALAKIIAIYDDFPLHWVVTGKKKIENYKKEEAVEEGKGKCLIDYEKRYNHLVDEYQLTNKENRELRQELKKLREKNESNKNTEETIVQ